MKKLLYTGHFLIVCVSIAVTGAERGYGDWPEKYPDHPGMRERRVLVLTNASRMSPTEYRDRYIGSYDILLPSNYPATDPLYLDSQLSAGTCFLVNKFGNNISIVSKVIISGF